MAMSEGEKLMAWILTDMKIEYEYDKIFHDIKGWKFDFVIDRSKKIAVEVEGGTFSGIVVCNHCHQKVFVVTKTGKKVYIRRAGRHNSGKGYEEDAKKYREAAILGWKVLRFTTDEVTKNPKMVSETIRRALCMK